MATMDPSAPVVDQDVSAVQGGAAYLRAIARRLAPYCERAEPRQRAMASVRGWLSPAERKHSGPLAAVSGDTTPDALQQLRRRAVWDPEAGREELRRYVLQHLGDSEAVLVLDETGCLKKGRHSAGVARQYRGTAGRVAHCQIGVLLGYASQLGHARLDRELSLPQAWTDARPRGRPAGIPEDQRVATKPPLASQMLPRRLATGVPAKWVTGESVDGEDRRLRLGLEAQPQASVLAVSGQESVWWGWPQRQVKTMLAAWPEAGWTRRRAGDGTKGPRWYDWRWLPLADPLDPSWRRWLLVRRRVRDPTERRGDVVFAPQDTTLAAVGRVAGTRWVIAQRFEAAKGEGGLDHDDGRSWTGWYRPMPLALWALALLTVLRAGALAGDAFTKSLPPVQKHHPLAAFKARRGLASRCACPSGGGYGA
jgi:SRSO17 transposase